MILERCLSSNLPPTELSTRKRTVKSIFAQPATTINVQISESHDKQLESKLSKTQIDLAQKCSKIKALQKWAEKTNLQMENQIQDLLTQKTYLIGLVQTLQSGCGKARTFVDSLNEESATEISSVIDAGTQSITDEIEKTLKVIQNKMDKLASKNVEATRRGMSYSKEV